MTPDTLGGRINPALHPYHETHLEWMGQRLGSRVGADAVIELAAELRRDVKPVDVLAGFVRAARGCERVREHARAIRVALVSRHQKLDDEILVREAIHLRADFHG